MISELRMMRAAPECANPGKTQATSHAAAPTDIGPHSTGRPWKTRAALQIMPQATNSSAFAMPDGKGGEIRSSTLQIATEKPPIR